MNKIKVSVVITVYNVEEYLQECVESILNQTLKEIEIICVEDCSTDSSLKILHQLKEEDERIIIIQNEKNKGLATSRNVGYRAAKGEYIVSIDADDILRSNALEKLYETAIENHAEIVTFEADVFGTEEMKDYIQRSKDLYHRKNQYLGVYKGAELFALFMDNGDIHGNMVMNMVKTNFFQSNNLYALDGMRYFEDSPLKMYVKAERVVVIPDRFYLRRFRENSLVTSNKEFVHLESVLIQMVDELLFLQNSNLSKDLKDRIEYSIRGHHLFFEREYEKINKDECKENLLDNYPLSQYIYRYFIQKKDIMTTSLTKEVMDKIRNKRILLYGAGEIAARAIKVLEENNISDFLVAVTNKNEKDYFMGHEIRQIDELIEYNTKAVVLIATTRRYYKEIKEKLLSLGFENMIYVD